MTNLMAFDNSGCMGKLDELRGILKAKVDKKEITQIKLAKMSGVDQGSISRFLNQGDGLSLDNFFSIADCIGAKFFWPHEIQVPYTYEMSALREKAESLSIENADLMRQLLAIYRAKEQAPPQPALPPSSDQHANNGSHEST